MPSVSPSRLLTEVGCEVSDAREGCAVSVSWKGLSPLRGNVRCGRGSAASLGDGVHGPYVTVDLAEFSSETLHNAMQEPLDKIRVGRLRPESIAVWLLLPDTTAPMAVPSLVDGLVDDPVLRNWARDIALNNAAGLQHSVEVLAELGLVEKATVEVKVYRATSWFKLYVLNRRDVFFGFYPLRERTLAVEGEARTSTTSPARTRRCFITRPDRTVSRWARSTSSRPRRGSRTSGPRSRSSVWHDRRRGEAERDPPFGQARAAGLRRPGLLGVRGPATEVEIKAPSSSSSSSPKGEDGDTALYEVLVSLVTEHGGDALTDRDERCGLVSGDSSTVLIRPDDDVGRQEARSSAVGRARIMLRFDTTLRGGPDSWPCSLPAWHAP